MESNLPSPGSIVISCQDVTGAISPEMVLLEWTVERGTACRKTRVVRHAYRTNK